MSNDGSKLQQEQNEPVDNNLYLQIGYYCYPTNTRGGWSYVTRYKGAFKEASGKTELPTSNIGSAFEGLLHGLKSITKIPEGSMLRIAAPDRAAVFFAQIDVRKKSRLWKQIVKEFDRLRVDLGNPDEVLFQTLEQEGVIYLSGKAAIAQHKTGRESKK